jgi:DNA-binding LytR/AlgR family response regulator
MPGMLGTQFLQTLNFKPFVIFVTAYEHYALESYDLSAVDYLMKPVSLERFTLAAHKAFDLFKSKKNGEINSHSTFPIAEPTEPLEDFFFVNVEYSLVRISIPQITYIEGLKDYVKIYLEGERRPVLTKATMKSMELKVSPHLFMRVHKSYIVNTRKIEAVKQQRIKIGSAEIPVSDSHAADLMEKLNLTRPS